MSRKPGIPSIPPLEQRELHSVLVSMKENIELLTGVRNGNISAVSSTASLTEVIAALNAVINRINS